MAGNKNKDVSPHLNRFYYPLDQAVEKPFNWKQMLRLLYYIKPYAKTLMPAAMIAMLISTIVRLVVPILIGKVVIDKAIAEKDVNLLVYLIIGISIRYLLNYVANMFRIKWVNILGQRIIHDLRKGL